MAIEKVKINNFKCFKGCHEIILNQGLNIFVGNNGTGKSTILEAIHLALTGIIRGRHIKNELSQYLFNKEIVNEYIKSLKNGNGTELPKITIEIFYKNDTEVDSMGNKNSRNENCEGFTFEIAFDEAYKNEYEKLVKQNNINSLPIEYYEVKWETFARSYITPRNMVIKSAFIDSTQYRYTNYSDIYISNIIKNSLDDEQVIHVSQAHREMKKKFNDDESVKSINQSIAETETLFNQNIALTVDLCTQNAWENSFIIEVDNTPFSFIGKGMQSVIKTELAMRSAAEKNKNIVLIEEPENHLSYTNLNKLIKHIEDNYDNQQVIISTHNSFVANKLGLDKLNLLANNHTLKLTNLSTETFNYFKKLSYYDTLRMILSKKTILVEGPSDELIIQKAYKDKHGKLPIENQVDIISVGTSFLRFLEIAKILELKVVVATDNDGNTTGLDKKYKNYKDMDNITICYDEAVSESEKNMKDFNYDTLEPALFRANNKNIEVFNNIFNKKFNNDNELLIYMINNKTECALAIFESDEILNYPNYINRAIENE